MGDILLGNEEQRNRYDSAHGGMMPQDSDEYLNVDTGKTGQNYSQSEYAPQGPGVPIGSGGGGRAGGSALGMAGLLLASGVPFSKAMQQGQQMAQQQQEGNYQRMMQMQKMQEMQQKQAANDMLMNEIMGNPTQMQGGDEPSMPQMGGSTLNTNASTLADAIGSASSPSNMTASSGSISNGSSMQGAPASSGGLFGNVDPQTRKMAAILLATGDKSGALKLLNDARASELPGGFTKDAMMGPARGGQGGTYTNPQTGQIISSNTNSMTSTDQSSIGATERVVPQLEEILKTLPQFQTKSKQSEAWVQEVFNEYLGSNYKLPSERAKGEALINTSAEGMMKAFNLPSTNESLEMVKAAISPKKGESATAYEERLKAEIENLRMFQKQAKNRLAHGTVLEPGMQPGQSQSQQMPNSQADLGKMAQDAIARGADPQAVRERLKKLTQGR